MTTPLTTATEAFLLNSIKVLLECFSVTSAFLQDLNYQLFGFSVNKIIWSATVERYILDNVVEVCDSKHCCFLVRMIESNIEL